CVGDGWGLAGARPARAPATAAEPQTRCPAITSASAVYGLIRIPPSSDSSRRRYLGHAAWRSALGRRLGANLAIHHSWDVRVCLLANPAPFRRGGHAQRAGRPSECEAEDGKTARGP